MSKSRGFRTHLNASVFLSVLAGKLKFLALLCLRFGEVGITRVQNKFKEGLILFELVRKAKKNQKGFTLVELMVTVVIIGVLVAIVIPIYSNVQENARNKAHDANYRILYGAASMMVANDGADAAGTYNATDGGALLSDYLDGDEWPENPTGGDTYVVEITSEGVITVTPPRIGEGTEESEE